MFFGSQEFFRWTGLPVPRATLTLPGFPPVHHPPGQIEHDLDSSQKLVVAGPQRLNRLFWGWVGNQKQRLLPIPSMYGIFTYIGLIFMVNVGKYTMHGLFGLLEKWAVVTLFLNRPVFFQWYEQFFGKVEVWSRTSKWLAEERWTMSNEGKGRCSTTRWSPTSYTNGIITPISRVITPVTHLYRHL